MQTTSTLDYLTLRHYLASLLTLLLEKATDKGKQTELTLKPEAFEEQRTLGADTEVKSE